MSKKIVFSFPGVRGTEIPLLYFGAKHYEDKGYEKRFIKHPISGNDFDALYENAKAILESFDLGEYDDIVFVAKSLGTVVACRLKEELNVNASLVLFTPLADTLPFIKGENRLFWLPQAITTDIWKVKHYVIYVKERMYPIT